MAASVASMMIEEPIINAYIYWIWNHSIDVINEFNKMNAQTEYNHVNFLSYRYKNKNNGTHVAKCRKPSLAPPNVMIRCLEALDFHRQRP